MKKKAIQFTQPLDSHAKPDRHNPFGITGASLKEMGHNTRWLRPIFIPHFLAWAIASFMSEVILLTASSVLISPTMAWVTRVTVGNMMARLNM